MICNKCGEDKFNCWACEKNPVTTRHSIWCISHNNVYHEDDKK